MSSSSHEVEVSNSGLTRQITSTFLVSMMTLNAGMASGWVTPMKSVLKGHDSPVGVLDDQEIFYLAALPEYVGFFLAFFYGFVATRFGRKEGLICVGIPSIVSGAVLTFAKSKVALTVGRSFAGASITGGIYVSTMYVSEIVQDSLRGTLIAFCMFQFNVGFFLSSLLGKILNYQSFNLIGIVLPTVYTLFILYLPESPHFLVTNTRIKDAMRSLTWLRGSDYKLAKVELENIRPPNRERPSYGEILKLRGTKSALIVSTSSFILQSGSGLWSVLMYMDSIFIKISRPLSQSDSSIAISLLVVISSLMNFFLIDMIGRKPLLFISFVGGCISLSALSSFLYIEMGGTDVRHFSWIPLSSVIAFVVVYSVGVSAVPNVLANELPPSKVKPAISSLASAASLVTIVTITQTFPYLKENVGVYFTFCIPAVFNLLGAFYTWFFVPETIGKSLRAIKNELNGMRCTSHPQQRISGA